MFFRSRTGRLLSALVLPGLILLGSTAPAQAGTTSAPAAEIQQSGSGSQGRSAKKIVQREVSFTVRNVNRSKIACAADGKTYTVRGHITGPQRELRHPESVTLFLHGLSYGEFFTNYTAQPGYNFAAKQARAGQVTVTVDRLGYDRSDKPVGTGICFGSRADIAHQIVLQLRSGKYQAGGTDRTPSGAVIKTPGGKHTDRSPSFDKVVLAGHSVGAIIAQAEAYSFGDIDGLMVLSYSDTSVSAAAQTALKTAIAECAAGGERSDGTSGPTGYVYFGAATPEQFIAAHFYTPNAAPRVVRTTAALRNRDPCGDITSYQAAVAANLANVGAITVPVLVLIGTEDAIYPIRALEQARLLTGSDDVTAVNIPATGHALTLHYSRNVFSARVSAWLDEHGFGR